MALPHSGNWDMAGVWLAQNYGTFTTVAERLKPESLYDRFVDYRESLGFEVLPLTGGRAAAVGGARRAAARQPVRLPDGRPRPVPLRCPGATSSASRPGCPPARRSWRSRPALRCMPGPRLLRRRRLRGPDRRRRWTPSSGDIGRHHPGAGRPVRARTSPPIPQDWHMLQPLWLADLSDETRQARASPAGRPSLMRIGMVCPYSFDVPGGVQAHVLQLAEVMRERGHEVSVLAPSSPHVEAARLRRLRRQGRPDSRTTARWPGCGSARPPTARSRGGSPTGEFDVLHLHEPNAPSLSMLALMIAEGPIVATFHTSTTKSLTLSVFQGILRPCHEKIVGRIAVSDLARRWQMEALGSDAVRDPQRGRRRLVRLGSAAAGLPARPAGSVLFLGRFDEPRKGMAVLLGRAARTGASASPTSRSSSSGRGDEDDLREEAGDLAGHLRFLGQVDDAEKASALRSADVYCAPQHRRRELRHRAGRGDGGRHRRWWPATSTRSGGCWSTAKAGLLVPVEDSAALAEALIAVLADDGAARPLRRGRPPPAVHQYDWSVVADQICGSTRRSPWPASR